MGSCLSKRNLSNALKIIQSAADMLDLPQLEIAATLINEALAASRSASRTASVNDSPTRTDAV